MNNKAFYNLTYGVFFVGDKSGGKGERLHCEYRRAGRGGALCAWRFLC